MAELWGGDEAKWTIGGDLHWTELEQIQRRINRRVTGEETIDPYAYFGAKRLWRDGAVRRALTLGCGLGELERGLAQYGAIRSHDAVDISRGAIERARAAAEEMGLRHIRYSVLDLNTGSLERGAYDAIFGVHAIHHVERLEHLFREVRLALAPGGYFMLNEYVGPSRFQFTERQVAVVNGLLATLPESLRRSRAHPGEVKRRVRRPTIAKMKSIDPSEAVRSAEILPLLQSHLEVLEVRGYGGTVLAPLLHEIAGNFRDAGPEGERILAALCDVEEALIDLGDLSDDFAVIIARRP